MRTAGTTTASSVEVAEDVDKIVFFPFANQTACLMLCGRPVKFDPVIVSVRSGLPATVFVGEIELITTNEGVGEGAGVGGGCCTAELLPQPHKANTVIVRSTIPTCRNI